MATEERFLHWHLFLFLMVSRMTINPEEDWWTGISSYKYNKLFIQPFWYFSCYSQGYEGSVDMVSHTTNNAEDWWTGISS